MGFSTDTMVEMASVTARVLAEECCDQYRWMTIAAVIFGFFMAFGIGANDVANAFATSVSAKSITLKQAVLIAAVCEFLGAMLLGASVTSTIRKSIIDGDRYTEEPDVLMFGMLTALVSASIMMMIANYLALPISTTHTIIASIVGFSLAAKGFESVIWKTVGLIFVSWIAAPAITGVFSAIFFWFIRRFVLRSDSPYKRCVAIYPVTIFLAVGLDIFMVLYKAGKNNDKIKEWGFVFQIPVSWGISAVFAAVFYFAMQPTLERRIAAKFDKEDGDGDGDVENGNEGDYDVDALMKKEEEQSVELPETAKEVSYVGSTDNEKNEVVAVDDDSKDQANTDANIDGEKKPKNMKNLMRMASKSFQKLGDATINRDIEAEAFAMSQNTQAMWESGENFDPKAEMMFSYLQVLTACLLSFAHGANDVANAIAPLSAVLLIYESGHVAGKAPVQKWVLALGGAGIVLGLALYGYKLIISLGYRMVKVSPSRGFAIELSAATVVIVASFLGIPISTTQCKVGGTTAVGMFDGKNGVDPWFLAKVIMGWVLTFFGVCILNAGIFAFAFYAPSANGYA